VINVSGVGGTISQVTVSLNGFSHTWPSDVDVLLVGPAGQKVAVMSDACGGWPGANNITLTLSDAAVLALPVSGPVVSGTYKPMDYEPGDGMLAPAPAGPYATTLSAFNGLDANGTWSLYVVDDGSGDQGSFAGGWSLTITTSSPGPSSLVSVEKPPRIETLKLGSFGEILLTVSGEVGRIYALETSSNLIQWQQAGVMENASGIVVFSDPVERGSIRFYRVATVPRSALNNQ
jgi:hypothetical protein